MLYESRTPDVAGGGEYCWAREVEAAFPSTGAGLFDEVLGLLACYAAGLLADDSVDPDTIDHNVNGVAAITLG
jgi:hypothetical protein